MLLRRLLGSKARPASLLEVRFLHVVSTRR